MSACNVPNRTIFCRDNLDILAGIDSGCIDLIYLDPPFNKNKTFTAPVGSSAKGASFDDIFRQEDVKDEWLLTLCKDHPGLHCLLEGIRGGGGKSYNFAYLSYMAIRLIECRRTLKDTGSIYLHCDPTMSHYLKMTMDCIFGEDHFRNEIVWGYEKPRSSKKQWRRNHDILLFYSKNQIYTFNPQRVPLMDGSYELRKPFKRPDGTLWKPKEPGKQAGSWWYDIPSFATCMGATERTGYPTQKPLTLLERIIKVSSNPGDMVLDPFCGSATTCIAAERLDRKWIGIDKSTDAYRVVRERLDSEVDKPQADWLKGEIRIQMSTEPPVRSDSDAIATSPDLRI